MEDRLQRANLSREQTRQLMRRLAEERARRGLTQAEVAREMGTSQPYIAKLEAGANEPKLSTFLLYAGIVAGAVLLGRILRDMGRMPGVR
jgi:transcriptional regulator with XRE-family HTH domain